MTLSGIQSFIEIGSGIQKLRGDLHTDTQQGDLISLFLFLQNKKTRLKMQFLLHRRHITVLLQKANG
jgi:hypothetical protein